METSDADVEESIQSRGWTKVGGDLCFAVVFYSADGEFRPEIQSETRQAPMSLYKEPHGDRTGI